MNKGVNKTRHRLISSHDEVDNVRTFVFEAGDLRWIAGQNQGWILPHQGDINHDNEHWFTISSAPSEKTMNLTTRISQSAYKQNLNSLRPGDIIEVYELGGDFTWEDEPSERVVMVAAGIGITPFRSILVERANMSKRLNASLLYFNRDSNVPFRELLEDLASSHPEFKLHILTGEPVTVDAILQQADEAKDKVIYISGPKALVISLSDELQKRGLQTKQDRFSGYDDASY